MKLLTGLLLTIFVAVSANAAKPPTTNPPPIILTAPVSQVVTQGSTARFTISAQLPSGIKGPKPALKYQWYVHSPGATTTNVISTETNSILTLPSVQYASQGQYLATVSYDGGVPTQKMATLTVPTTNILAGCNTTNYVGIQWNYDLAGDPAVKKFKVNYGTDVSSFSTQIVTAPNLQSTISNLLADKIYYIEATAVNTNSVNNESLPSNRLLYAFGSGCGNVPYSIDIIMLTNSVPRIISKLCPGCPMSILRSSDLVTWIEIGATVADQYGNVIFDDHNAPADHAFYRMAVLPIR
jgi:hypothetical protein